MMSNRYRLVRGPRRKTVWARNFNLTTGTAGIVADILVDFRNEMGILRNLPGTTITRVVGTHTTRVTTTDDAFTRWVWGLYVGHIDVFPSVTDNPLGAPGLDWMFVRSENVVQVQDAGTPVVKRVASYFDIDLRAQRKMDEIGQTLYYIGDNPEGDAFDVVWNFNVLLKLP